MQVPLFWITVFVNILQLSFSIYFFLIWTWLSDRQTLVSVYIQRNPALRPPRLYDHLLPQLTSHSLSTQTWKSPSHFIILKTSSMRPPRYHDQDFMAQRWSHQRGSVPVKGSHSEGETISACAKACWGQCFFLSARRVTLLYETGFLHIKRIKTFGYKTCNREGIRKKIQNSPKK